MVNNYADRHNVSDMQLSVSSCESYYTVLLDIQYFFTIIVYIEIRNKAETICEKNKRILL